MIVPTNRLILLCAVVVPPFAALAGVAPPMAPHSAAVIGALFLIAALDAYLSSERLRGVTLELPDVVRLARERSDKLEFRVCNDTRRPGSLRIGLAFPREVTPGLEDMEVRLDGGASFSSLSWPLAGRKHGKYLIERYFLETPSPLGLWAARKSVPCMSEIRVYPNLEHDRKTLAPHFFGHGSGSHFQRRIGKGREFEHLREYLPGDSYEDIHWKATARRSYPVTKIYQVERMQEIYMILDASRLSAREIRSPHGTAGPSTVFDRYMTAALMMGRAAERNGDLFGVLTFSEKVLSFIPAKSGKAHYSACRDAVYTLEARQVAPDYAELFTFIGTRIRRRALLIFLTGLDDPVLSADFEENVVLAARRHLILVNMLRPPSARPLFSSAGGVESINDIYRSLGGHMLWARLKETESALKRKGVGFALLDNEKMCAELLSQYLRIKRRQAL